jgi:hypothetical protein
MRLAQIGVDVGNQKLQQPVEEFPFPSAFGFVPWGIIS